MTGKTHVQFGFISSCITIKAINHIYPGTFNNIEDIITYLLLCGLGATFPDIDSGKSWISQALYGIDDLLRKIRILKHRGISHFNFRFKGSKKRIKKYINRLIMALLRYLIIFILVVYSIFICDSILIRGLIIGYCSHIILDYITTYLHIKTNSVFELKYIYNILGFISILYVIYTFNEIFF